MNIGVPSRFACLKIEDDDSPTPRSKEVKKKPDNKVNKKPDKGGNKETTQKKPAKQTTSKKDKKKTTLDKQWEEWKQIDNALVDDQYEGELHEAIMLSKIEYEKAIKNNSSNSTDSNENKKTGNKKKKNKSIPLNEFLGNAGANEKETVQEEKADTSKTNFFKNVQLETQQELTKEKVIAKRKAQEVNIDERITIAQYEEKLLKEKTKNKELNKEIDILREELKTVKSRNKALCDMLGHGEMKDKADVLSELERLNSVKNELTEEVTRLHALLEQERSKVASLSDSNKHKEKVSN